MWDFLDRLREKPESVRFQIAIVTAALITGVIVLIWFSSFSLQFGLADEEKTQEEPSPLEGVTSGFREAIHTGFSGFGAFFDELKQIQYTEEEVNGDSGALENSADAESGKLPDDFAPSGGASTSPSSFE